MLLSIRSSFGFALVVVAAACGGKTTDVSALGTDGGSSGSSGGTSSGSSGSSGGGTSSGGASSSSGGGSGSSSSGGATSSSSGGGSGSSSGGVSSSSSSGSSSGAQPSFGEVQFSQCAASVLCPTTSMSFSATFEGSASTCTMTQSADGTCVAYACSGGSATVGGDSAGAITLRGPHLPGVVPVSFTAGTYDYSAEASYISAGDTLTVTASGSTVPAFVATMVAPNYVTLVSPTLANGGLTISTSTDLQVTWSGGDPSPDTLVVFEGLSTGTDYFECVWPAATGMATVPQSMLATVSGQSSGYVLYGQFTGGALTAGDYSLDTGVFMYTGDNASFE
jgi:hypothetical protein